MTFPNSISLGYWQHSPSDIAFASMFLSFNFSYYPSGQTVGILTFAAPITTYKITVSSSALLFNNQMNLNKLYHLHWDQFSKH